MPASNASAGYGTRFGIEGTTPGTYVYVAEVVSLTPPSWTRDTIEVTHLESPDKTKEYIGSLIDAGEATITVNYIPAVSDALLASFTAETDKFRILLPGGDIALDFAGIVTGYEIGDLVGDDKMSATFTVKATGKPAFVAVP
jgi:Lambda phage tail tube protein, TTP